MNMATLCTFVSSHAVLPSHAKHRSAVEATAPRRQRIPATWRQLRATAAPTPVQADKPKWAGGGPISDLVNFLIAIPPLYALMKLGARQVLISEAEKNGVPWQGKVAELERELPERKFQAEVEAITNPNLEYPDYYLVPFHAYEEGNLSFLAAAEACPATYATSLRVWPADKLSPAAALQRLRKCHLDAVFAEAPVGWADRQSFVAVDAGCSVGLSTLAVVERLQSVRSGSDTRVIGLDASPHMLVVAKQDAACGAEYVHGFAENCGLEDASVDWFGLQFVVHELPAEATREVFSEALRVLRPGGVLSLIDNDPASPVIQGRPPAIATLMKSTEPHSDSYYSLDVVALMTQVGFKTATSTRTDPRHHTVVGVKA